jgi:uncharacterized membrane protein (Fun14 family)
MRVYRQISQMLLQSHLKINESIVYMSLEQIGLQVGAGALIGYTTGWGLKKLLKLIIKLAAIVLAAFCGGLLWLQVQRIVTVDWNELENKTRNSMEWLANTAVNNNLGNQSLDQVMDSLGLAFAAPMGLAFVAGFMKG